MICLNVSPPNSYLDILMLNRMILGGGGFGRWLGHESGALTNGIGALIKRDPAELLSPFHHVVHSKKRSL